MKGENVIIILYISISIFIICAVTARAFLDQDKISVERAPAIYYVKRADIRPEFDKYNIYQGDQLVAIVNLYMEDFEHDLQ